MKGDLYIDGNDASTLYGVGIAQSGLNGVAAFPPMASVNTTEWYDEDGIDADLLNPVLDARQVQVLFYCTLETGYASFIRLLEGTPYHTFNFAVIGLSLRLRLVSEDSINTVNGKGTFTLTMACDDDFLDGYTYAAPEKSISDTGFLIDGTDMALYGIRPTSGAREAIAKETPMRANLTVKAYGVAGQQYDDGASHYGTRDIAIPFNLKADTLTAFWARAKAFLHDLIQPRGRVIQFEGRQITVYYKSCTVNDIVPKPGGGLWCDFTMTFAVIADERMEDD
ncbi:MAG: hypothetical protein LKK08_06355 [Bacteroidales bacterium]|jgi:hypothetical protein|nr:hypothetical protein [Bacteroidales bacterium]